MSINYRNLKLFFYIVFFAIIIIILVVFFSRQINLSNEYNSFISITNIDEFTIKIEKFSINKGYYTYINFNITDKELIKNLFKLIANSESKSDKEPRLYDIELTVYFIKNNEIVSHFDFFKDENDKKTYIAFRSKKKETILLTGVDYNNVIHKIVSQLSDSIQDNEK